MTYVKRRAGSRISSSAYPGPTQDLVRAEWENMARLRAVRWKRIVIEVLSDARQTYVHDLPAPTDATCLSLISGGAWASGRAAF